VLFGKKMFGVALSATADEIEIFVKRNAPEHILGRRQVSGVLLPQRGQFARGRVVVTRVDMQTRSTIAMREIIKHLDATRAGQWWHPTSPVKWPCAL
jgi:hypothetical protein